jgi:hypothetical protein
MFQLDAVGVNKKRAQPLIRVLYIPRAKAGIHEHQPVAVGFDKLAMAHQLRGHSTTHPIPKLASDRTHAAAIEMMNAHVETSPAGT